MLSHEERNNRRLDIIRLFTEENKNIGEISITTHLSPESIKKVLRDFGVWHAEKPSGAEPAYNIISALINTIDSYSDIARRYNITPERVRQISVKCIQHGINLHPERKLSNGQSAP